MFSGYARKKREQEDQVTFTALLLSLASILSIVIVRFEVGVTSAEWAEELGVMVEKWPSTLVVKCMLARCYEKGLFGSQCI